MALGYQGMILLNGKLFLVTDGNLDHARPEIVSEGTYAASDLNRAVNKVHVFDFDELSGGFNCDTNIELVDQLFNLTDGWVTNRDNSLPFLWYSNITNNYEFGDAYWTRISLSAGAGNLLTTSFDVSLIPGAEPTSEDPDRYELPTRKLQLADNYIAQRFGLSDDGESPLLNPSQGTQNISFSAPDFQLPIPYWQTSFTFTDANGDELPQGVEIINWSLELTNNITKRNLCSAVSDTEDHPGPALIQVGLAAMTLNITFVTVVTLDENGDPLTEYNVPEKFNNVIIKIQNKSETREISLGRFDSSTNGNDFSKPIQETSDASNISGVGGYQEMSYVAQGYFTLPHIQGT